MEKVSDIRTKKVLDEVMASLDRTRDISDDELYAHIDRRIQQYARQGRMTLTERRLIRRQVFSAIRELDVLQPLLDDPEVTDVKMEA